MVSKGNKFRKQLLVITGTTSFPFTRLFYSLDNTLQDLNDNTIDTIIQTSSDPPHFYSPQVKIVHTFSPNKLISLIQTSQKIISHAGYGSILLIMRYSPYLPLIIPRLTLYKEQVDNHQLEFITFLNSKLPHNVVDHFVTTNNIQKSIADYLDEKPIKYVHSSIDFIIQTKKRIHKIVNAYLNKQSI